MSLRTALASRLAQTLASNEQVEDTEERADASKNAGCAAVTSVRPRTRCKVAGVLRSVVLRPREGVPTVEAELFDGSGALDLVWLGRRTIDGIEPVGNEIFVNMTRGGQALVMRVAPQALPQVGESIRVAIHPKGLHFFDAETGERLNTG